MQDSNDEKLLTINEISELLNVTKGWIYARTMKKSKNQIPHYKLGKFIRFNLNEVLTWLLETRRY